MNRILDAKGSDAGKVNDDSASIVLIGAGLPRTGTLSLRGALNILLPGKCYHMKDVAEGKKEDKRFWDELIDADEKQRPEMLRKFFTERGYSAGVDFPISRFYKEFMIAFPEAKVLLSMRSPESWHKSVRNTIYKAMTAMNNPIVRAFLRLVCDLETASVMRKIGEPIYEANDGDEKRAVEYFNSWADEVKRRVPEDRLLIFDVRQGWASLCKFLNVQEPNEPFPNLNDTATLKAEVRKLMVVSHVVVLGIIPLLILAAILIPILLTVL